MSKRNLLLLGFAVAVAAQLAVPAWLIIEHEWTLREGLVFKFKTRPIDPADAFRGRYVWLNLEPNPIHVPDINAWRYNQKAFAVLDLDTNGFANVVRLANEAPVDQVCVPVHVSWSDGRKGELHIAWTGLDRFYMTEAKAPAAETAYREHNRRKNAACYVSVRIRGSHAVLENLFIEDKPIHDWLKSHPSGK